MKFLLIASVFSSHSSRYLFKKSLPDKKEKISDQEPLIKNDITRENLDKTKLQVEVAQNPTNIFDSSEVSESLCKKGSKFENFRFSNEKILRTVGLGDKMPPLVRMVRVFDAKGTDLGIAERRGIGGGFYYESGKYAYILNGYSAEIVEIDERISETIRKKEEKFNSRYKQTFEAIPDTTVIKLNSGKEVDQKEIVYRVAKRYGIDPALLLSAQITEDGSQYTIEDYEVRLIMEARNIQNTLVKYEKKNGVSFETQGESEILDIIAAFSATYSANDEHLEKIAKKYCEFTGKKFDLSETNLRQLKEKYISWKEQRSSRGGLRLDPRTEQELKEILAQEQIDPETLKNNEKLFFESTKRIAQYIESYFGIPWKVTIGQMLLETGHGRHAPGNNYFGMKDFSGGGSNLETTEYVDGKPIRTNSSFRVYKNIWDSFFDYAKLLMKPRYAKVFESYRKGEIRSSEEYIVALAKAGYCTTPAEDYARRCDGALKKYGETLFDSIAYNGVKYEPTYEAVPTGGSFAVRGKIDARTLIENAKQFEGTPYRWGGNSENGIDCSGLVIEAAKEVVSGDTTANGLKNLSTPIPKTEGLPGDLIFWGGNATHVAIITKNLGDGKYEIVDASGKSARNQVAVREITLTSKNSIGRAPFVEGQENLA